METRDADHIAAFIRQRDETEREKVAAWRARLVASARELARCLVVDHGASRVWLFGSLAWGTPDEMSDIDLVVEGLDERRYFHALGAVLAAAPTRVDLVRVEEAEPGLWARVLDAGVLLWERS